MTKKRKLSNQVSNKKIKVLAYCDSPTCATGFGTVARNVFEALHKTGRYDIDILGINFWGDPHSFPYRIWPTGVNQDRDPYGRKKVAAMMGQMEYDILFLLQDSFILDFMPQVLPALKAQGKKFKSICYYPIDGTPKQQWIKNVTAADYVFTYSQFGLEESKKAYPNCGEIGIIPHGANLTDFVPMDKEKINNFRHMFFGINADKFTILNLNRNQHRKDIPRTIAAFKEFRKEAPNSVLYLHCFASGTEVRTFNGIKEIQDIKVGDLVLTKNGLFKEVYETSCRPLQSNESMLKLNVVGRNKGIEATSNHRFLIISPENTGCGHIKCLPNCKSRWVYRQENWVSNCNRSISENYIPEWKEAKDINAGDYLLIPIPKNKYPDMPDIIYVSDVLDSISKKYILDKGVLKTSNHPKTKAIPNEITITKDLMLLFGYYLSEGCVRSRMDTVQFTFNINEVDYINSVVKIIKDTFNLESIIEHFPDTSATRITVCSTALALFFKSLFGHSAYTKTYPEWFNFLDDNLFYSLLKGLFDGDGHYTDKFISYSSVSNTLVTLIRDGLLIRKFFMSIRTTLRPDGATFNGFVATVHSDLRRLYNNIGVDFVGDPISNIEHYHFFLEEYVACKVSSTEPSDYIGDVYNMSVRDDESYCVAGGYIAHNCAAQDQGWNLDEVVKSYGFNTKDDVLFPDRFGPNQGYPREVVNMIYNASDLVVSTTLGEGWGLSWVEAMATKTPVLMPANTVMKDLITEDKGYLCDSGTKPELFTVLPHDNEIIRPLVDTSDMARKMLYIYNNYEEAKAKAEVAYNWVSKELNWQGNVGKMWVDIFDKAALELLSEDARPEATAEGGTIQAESF